MLPLVDSCAAAGSTSEAVDLSSDDASAAGADAPDAPPALPSPLRRCLLPMPSVVAACSCTTVEQLRLSISISATALLCCSALAAARLRR